ncbi:MAG TPA: hypothetical protein VF736_00095 [Pyrinomonadaceae bacterium]|jgi:hypothetical protein
MGSVYVFNASTQLMRLSVNKQQQPGATIQAASKTTVRPYAPWSVQVARSNVATLNGAFVNGQTNSVTVHTQTGPSQAVDIAVPAASESTADLWLYVFAEYMILFDTGGKPLDQEPIQWGLSKGQGTKPRAAKRSASGGRRK